MIRVMYSFRLEARVAETNDMKDATPSNWNVRKALTTHYSNEQNIIYEAILKTCWIFDLMVFETQITQAFLSMFVTRLPFLLQLNSYTSKMVLVLLSPILATTLVEPILV